MKIIIAIIAIVLPLHGCAQHKPLEETAYINGQLKLFQAAIDEMVKSGHMEPEETPDLTSLAGDYSWHDGLCGKDPCHFGAYSFNKYAVAALSNMRSIYGQIAEGSDVLVDVGRGAFDPSIVGYRVGSLTYCSLHGGKMHHCDEDRFDPSIVVEYIDKNHVRINRKAKWDAEMHHLAIMPADYSHDCRCTSSSSRVGIWN